MDGNHLYLGTWQLVPELSLYEYGPQPASGVYLIEHAEPGLQLSVRWTMEPGEPERQTVFGGPADGRPRSIDPPPAAGPDSFVLSHVDERTLDSAALRAGAIVAYARRRASGDGQLLAVVQEGSRPSGGRYRNFQVYRRVNGALRSE